MAPWEEVVKLLERDGKSTEAGKVKEILAKHKDIGAQGRALKQLDWYATVIVPYLDELRVVNYNCLYEIYREPNDEEVMAQYREKGLMLQWIPLSADAGGKELTLCIGGRGRERGCLAG